MPVSCASGEAMRRREFIKLPGGTTAAWPFSVRAQQSAMPVTGFMSARSPDDSGQVLQAFLKGLGEAGFFDGQNVTIEYRWARGDYRGVLPAFAVELVQRRVNVLVATGGEASAAAANRATSTIPIVFVMGDPVRAGLVESLNRPGGNATGSYVATSTPEMEQKRLSLLHELTPGVPLIGALLNPNLPDAARQLPALEEAARTIGRRLFVAKASNDDELKAAFALLLQERIGALLVAADAYFDTRRDRIIAFASQNRLPTVYHFREYAFAGGLVSYGPSITDAYRQAGNYTGRVLKGEKPAELPVVQTTKFDFVINLKTAKTLGLAVPFGLLNAADEVIE
jgi:putative tryptophan/tyrosine transport system substrate-binding protein